VTSSPNPFGPELFRFLAELARNNRRDWFEANKARYEADVKEPALRFITDFAGPLAGISRHFRAIPSATRGSFFRIHRDIRFSGDKSPYKTFAGIHFRHETRGDVHVPGFYLHLEPNKSFVGMGIWRPDPPTLSQIRGRLVKDPAGWRRAIGSAAFKRMLRLSGESLKTPPRGYNAEHPLIEDIKRKDFVAIAELTNTRVLAKDFPRRFAKLCEAGGGLVRWLCLAVGVPY
jgi:uncharacterized protein (TIGR02453 family)